MQSRYIGLMLLIGLLIVCLVPATIYIAGGTDLDETSYGSMYITSSSATTITTGGTWYKLLGSTAIDNNNNFSMTADNRLEYTGDSNGTFLISISGSISPSEKDVYYALRVAKNGTTIGNSEVRQESFDKIQNDEQVFSINNIVELMPNDYLELWGTWESGTNGETLTLIKMNFNATQIDFNVAGAGGGGGIASTDWNDITNFPTGCPAGHAVQIIDKVPTCIAVGGSGTDTNVWEAGWLDWDSNNLIQDWNAGEYEIMAKQFVLTPGHTDNRIYFDGNYIIDSGENIGVNNNTVTKIKTNNFQIGDSCSVYGSGNVCSGSGTKVNGGSFNTGAGFNNTVSGSGNFVAGTYNTVSGGNGFVAGQTNIVSAGIGSIVGSLSSTIGSNALVSFTGGINNHVDSPGGFTMASNAHNMGTIGFVHGSSGLGPGVVDRLWNSGYASFMSCTAFASDQNCIIETDYSGMMGFNNKILGTANTAFVFGQGITATRGNTTYVEDLNVNKSIVTGGNSFDGLSNGDINVSTVYYDTLSAKSPVVYELDNDNILTYNQKTKDWVECNPRVSRSCPREAEEKMERIYEKREDYLSWVDAKESCEDGSHVYVSLGDFEKGQRTCLYSLEKVVEACEDKSLFHYYSDGECLVNHAKKCEAGSNTKWDFNTSSCVIDVVKDCLNRDDMFWDGKKCVFSQAKRDARLEAECAFQRDKIWDGEKCVSVGV